ncbi:MAG: hypothetical protein IJD17_05490 [Clostridia bacterium]|nr:hypothetical protein [Clostridia bacterium]
MKKIRIIAALVLALCLFGLSAFAAESTPSVSDKDVTGGTAKIYDKDDNVIHDVPDAELVITPIKDKDSADADIKGDLEAAEKELKDKDLTTVPGFEDAWTGATKGAPIKNAVVSDIFDVRVIGESATKFVEGTTIGFTLKVQGLDKNDKFVLIKKDENGNWSVQDYTLNADGSISVKTDKLGVFAVVRDNGEVEVKPDAPSSPQTGVADFAVPAALAIMALGGCAVYFGKKAFAN